MEDVPADVMIDILSRLPVKTIIHCKCVCKKWSHLVLESSFVSLHLSKSPKGLIIHNNPARSNDPEDPGFLNWVEIELEDEDDDNHRLHHDLIMTLKLNLAPILQNSEIHQVGSVNGLICLWQFDPDLDNIYICNPITREYMILPGHPCSTQTYAEIIYGFGVSSLPGEYKVVRASHWVRLPNESDEQLLEIEVYTLGTCQWRSLFTRLPYRLGEHYGSNTPFLNNHCHWIVYDKEDRREREKICSFDLDKETFQLFSFPPCEREDLITCQTLAVLKGCLCKVDIYESQLTIWVMKEYGIKESWYKEVVIKRADNPHLEWLMLEPIPIHVIEGLEDGKILMVWRKKLWAFRRCKYPWHERVEDTQMIKYIVSGLVYRPSFIELGNFESELVLKFKRSTNESERVLSSSDDSSDEDP